MKWVYIAIFFFTALIVTSFIGKYQDTHIVKSIHIGAQP
jgi:hypothetical protein